MHPSLAAVRPESGVCRPEPGDSVAESGNRVPKLGDSRITLASQSVEVQWLAGWLAETHHLAC